MSLPSLQAVLNTQLPVVVCARPWARELLAGYALSGFVEMKGRWREDRAAVHAHRKKAQHAHARGLLLPDSLSSAMVFKFAGVPCAGYRDDGRSLILRWPISKPTTSLHAVQSWYHLTSQALKRWNLAVEPTHPPAQLGLALTSQQLARGRQALQAAGLARGKFVLMAPTATGLHHGNAKVWPYFEGLAQALQSKGYAVAMCPPATEADAARHNAPSALCLPPLDLAAFATLAQLASLVICNDSGVSHLAAAANARQLTLFGVTDRERTGPWSRNATCLGSAQQWPTLAEVQSQACSLLHTEPGT